jgi:hypothetical protein
VQAAGLVRYMRYRMWLVYSGGWFSSLHAVPHAAGLVRYMRYRMLHAVPHGWFSSLHAVPHVANMWGGGRAGGWYRMERSKSKTLKKKKYVYYFFEGLQTYFFVFKR